MKENEFLDGIGNVDSDIIERFVAMDNKLQKMAVVPVSKRIWYRVAAVAACLCIIVGLAFYIPYSKRKPPENIPERDIAAESFGYTSSGNDTLSDSGTVTAESVETPSDSTEKPTERPTEAPTEEPTEHPTETPTEEPTERPTETPTEQPTEEPTERPTETPTEEPTEHPTEAPTEQPTEEPTEVPTEQTPSEPVIVPPAPPTIYEPTVSPETPHGNSLEFIVGYSVGSSEGGSGAPPKFNFPYDQMAVKARVVNNYPDTYYKLNTGSLSTPTAYRLIQMETIEVIYGENIPQYFLYLLPAGLYVDMSVYDSLIIALYSQLGLENYVLKNGTQNRMEAFELPIFSDGSADFGHVIAFTDGVFDESLWQNKNWITGYQFGKYYLDHPETSSLVVYRGASESEVVAAVKERIQSYFSRFPASLYVKTLNFKTQEAKDALEYVKPFENGVFFQDFIWYGSGAGGKVVFTRFVNGCETEETVTIDLLTEEVTYSEIRYTEEDIKQLADMTVYVSEKAKEYKENVPTPPNADVEGKKLLALHLYAWYVKADGKLYGVVRNSWEYCKEGNYYLQYRYDTYTIYDMLTGSVADISREDLVGIVGNRNVYDGKYGEELEIPM